MRFQEAGDKFIALVTEIKSSSRIWLLHHADSDGCVSAIYLSTFLEKLGLEIERRFWILSSEYDLEVQKSIIESSSPEVLIFLDLDVISEGVLQGPWKKKVEKILIYDHHKIELSELQELLSEKKEIFYFNPRLLKEEKAYPASMFGYELLSKISNSKIPHWLLGAGLIGDHALDENLELKELVTADYLNLIRGTDYSEKKLYEITHLINAGYFHFQSRRKDLSFEVAREAFGLNQPAIFFNPDVGPAMELQKIKREIDSESARYLRLAGQNIMLEPEILLSIYLISTPHYLAGLVASKLTFLFPDYIILVGQSFNSKYSFEIRRGIKSKIDITEILLRQKNYFRSLSAGGHPAASGALVRIQDLEIFLETFKKALRDLIK